MAINTNPPNPHSKPLAIFLMGPTAIGKTDLAMELVQHIPAEIISVDSAMVYRGLDIGSGKPTPTQLKMAPHHLIDIKDPSEPYSAAIFSNDALKIMQEITGRNRIPLLVGGTFLYFKSLLQGLSPLPSADPLIRESLLKEAEKLGWDTLHQRLQKIDPKSAIRIHPNDPQRIQRALEVFEITGKPMSAFLNQSIQNVNFPYEVMAFAMLPSERQWLHQRIETRFQQMLNQGFIEEAEQLYECIKTGRLNLDLPSMRSVGYRQIFEYLANKISFDEMKTRAVAATRQLAKRQLTWLRNLKELKPLIISETSTNNHFDLCQTMVHFVLSDRGEWVNNP